MSYLFEWNIKVFSLQKQLSSIKGAKSQKNKEIKTLIITLFFPKVTEIISQKKEIKLTHGEISLEDCVP